MTLIKEFYLSLNLDGPPIEVAEETKIIEETTTVPIDVAVTTEAKVEEEKEKENTRLHAVVGRMDLLAVVEMMTVRSEDGEVAARVGVEAADQGTVDLVGAGIDSL